MNNGGLPLILTPMSYGLPPSDFHCVAYGTTIFLDRNLPVMQALI
jgi:hypothetical protein